MPQHELRTSAELTFVPKLQEVSILDVEYSLVRLALAFQAFDVSFRADVHLACRLRRARPRQQRRNFVGFKSTQ